MALIRRSIHEALPSPRALLNHRISLWSQGSQREGMVKCMVC